LFRQAARRLAPGGELRVVANQHLGYQRPLGKLFPRVDTVARNAKFVIFRCIKGGP
ncbi:MAG: methyltransferase, partial [Alcanivorax sp.]|nr:methyltransferase [Alcanivorax sp.]